MSPDRNCPDRIGQTETARPNRPDRKVAYPRVAAATLFDLACFMVILLCIILFAVRNLLMTAIWVKTSIYVYLDVLVEVPCSLKITLQCSANKKIWEPLM